MTKGSLTSGLDLVDNVCDRGKGPEGAGTRSRALGGAGTFPLLGLREREALGGTCEVESLGNNVADDVSLLLMVSL